MTTTQLKCDDFQTARVERAPSPAALDSAFDFGVDVGTDHYAARVSQRLSQSDEVRAAAACFTFFIRSFSLNRIFISGLYMVL